MSMVSEDIFFGWIKDAADIGNLQRLLELMKPTQRVLAITLVMCVENPAFFSQHFGVLAPYLKPDGVTPPVLQSFRLAVIGAINSALATGEHWDAVRDVCVHWAGKADFCGEVNAHLRLSLLTPENIAFILDTVPQLLMSPYDLSLFLVRVVGEYASKGGLTSLVAKKLLTVALGAVRACKEIYPSDYKRVCGAVGLACRNIKQVWPQVLMDEEVTEVMNKLREEGVDV